MQTTRSRRKFWIDYTLIAVAILAGVVVALLAGCDPEKGGQTPMRPQTTRDVPYVAGESECKWAWGEVATEVIPTLTDKARGDLNERYSAMIAYSDAVGSFPAACSDYNLNEMKTWIMYAGTLASYCVIGDDEYIDTTQPFTDGRTIGDWLLEYNIGCPL